MRAAPATPSRTPTTSCTPPSATQLSLDAQSLASSCALARAAHATPAAAVLASSLQRRIASPILTIAYDTYDWRVVLQAARRLAAVCLDEARPGARATAALYDALYGIVMQFPEGSLAFRLFGHVWRDVMSVLRAHVCVWLRHAVVEPGAAFFIDDSGETPRVLHDCLPSFVTREAAESILFAGNATKCCIRLASDTHITHVPTEPSANAMETLQRFEPLLARPISAPLSMDAVSRYWRTSAAERLSHVLPFPHIRRRIHTLRQYLLLGNGPFWRSFFDELRATAFLARGRDPALQDASEKGLNHILKSVTTDLLSHSPHDHATLDESADAPLYIRVTDTDDLLPVFTLSFAEGQVLSPRASVYCDVFSIAFSIRRVACELRAAFSALLALQRPLYRPARRAGARSVRAAMVPIFALRRRMADFVDGFEWYLQAEVLEPKFAGLLRVFDSHEEQKKSDGWKPREPFFDTVCSLHNELLDKIFAQCFVGDVQINTRLNQIFGICLDLCEFVQALSVETFGEQEHDEFVKSTEVDFSRNIALLVRMLLHMQKGHADSGIPALLLRINFNNYIYM